LQGTPEEDLERTLVENFQNEAIALDAVSHPNVVRRLGHGTAADLTGTPFHYIVLEYLSGGDLMALCRRRPLGFASTLFYVRQICEALEEAHARGIIHRDIKPNNLLISANEQIIKITDFGVAKLYDADPNAEVTRVGTDIYAPPEHNPNAVDGGVRERLTPSADVYSLAKTIYTAMTGKAPRQFVRRPITELPIELMREPWGPRLLAVLRRATADSAADRYASVRAFWDDLASLADLALETCDDEQTRVRARERLRHTGPVAPAAPAPDFRPQHNTSPRTLDAGAKIVVTLEGSAPPLAPVPSGPAKPVSSQAPPAEPAYSYTQDLKDLVGGGLRKGAAVVVGVLLLFGSVAAVYYEVQSYVVTRSLKRATVTAQTLTLRDGPSPSSNDIGKLPYGTRVRILRQEPNSTWCEIEVTQLGGPVDTEQPDRGWVNSKFLAVDAQ
jgi:serine/threonine protein kinase